MDNLSIAILALLPVDYSISGSEAPNNTTQTPIHVSRAWTDHPEHEEPCVGAGTMHFLARYNNVINGSACAAIKIKSGACSPDARCHRCLPPHTMPSNAAFLTHGHNVARAKRRAKQNTIAEIGWDEDAHREFLTGFHMQARKEGSGNQQCRGARPAGEA